MTTGQAGRARRGQLPACVSVYYEDREGDGGDLAHVDILVPRSQLAAHLCPHLSASTAQRLTDYLQLPEWEVVVPEEVRSGPSTWVIRPRPRGVAVQLDAWTMLAPDRHGVLDQTLLRVRVDAAQDLLTVLAIEARTDADLFRRAKLSHVRSTLWYAGYEYTIELDPYTSAIVGSSDGQFTAGNVFDIRFDQDQEPG